MANTPYHLHLASILIYLLLWPLYQVFLWWVCTGYKSYSQEQLTSELAKVHESAIIEVMVTDKHLMAG